MSNWFLASEKENYLIQELCKVVHAYWMKNTFDGMVKPGMRKYREWLKSYASKNTTRVELWFNPIVLKVLRVYPFYCFHYLFARLVRTDVACREIWDQTPYRSADPVHLVQSLGQSNRMTNEIRDILYHTQVPLYKLSWKKIPKEGILQESILDFVLMDK